jgi:small subunit ribosomal protein S2
MPIVTAKELLQAGAHFGHRTSRWNPKMQPYIYGKRNKIHIINLRETIRGLVEAAAFLRQIAREGSQILVVGTKRQAAGVVEREATRAGMPFVSQRWLGGTLTNLGVIRSRVKYLEELEDNEKNGITDGYSKKALAHHRREKRKVLRNLSGIRNLTGIPGALLVIDPKREHIAVREAVKAGVPVVAVLDTDCDPTDLAIPIPANDDALRSVEILLVKLTDAIMEGKGEAASYVRPPAEGDGRRGLAAASFGGEDDRRGRGRRGGPGGPGGRGGGRGRRTSAAPQHQVREKVRGSTESKKDQPAGAEGTPPPAPAEERSAPVPEAEEAEKAEKPAEQAANPTPQAEKKEG